MRCKAIAIRSPTIALRLSRRTPASTRIARAWRPTILMCGTWVSNSFRAAVVVPAYACMCNRDHVSFNGTCHGGALFSLADTAFGLASNSHGVVAAGIDAHITYPRAVKVGDVLTATAVEETRSRRFATYRVIVTRGDGATVATFTGTVAITETRQPVARP